MIKLDPRKETLLSGIIREYSKTADPVASSAMEKELRVSPATIRNEMAVLEKEGYLFQPHTSAGRIPTGKGYKYYISNCLENKEADVKEWKKIFESHGDWEIKMKTLARRLADELSQGIFVGFTPNSTYYTGLSQLFSQPEFESADLVRHLSVIIDNLDSVLVDLFKSASFGVNIYVGSENPFSDNCGTVLLKPKAKPMFGVIGPIRMDYDKTISIMKGIAKVL